MWVSLFYFVFFMCHGMVKNIFETKFNSKIILRIFLVKFMAQFRIRILRSWCKLAMLLCHKIFPPCLCFPFNKIILSYYHFFWHNFVFNFFFCQTNKSKTKFLTKKVIKRRNNFVKIFALPLTPFRHAHKHIRKNPCMNFFLAIYFSLKRLERGWVGESTFFSTNHFLVD